MIVHRITSPTKNKSIVNLYFIQLLNIHYFTHFDHM